MFIVYKYLFLLYVNYFYRNMKQSKTKLMNFILHFYLYFRKKIDASHYNKANINLKPGLEVSWFSFLKYFNPLVKYWVWN